MTKEPKFRHPKLTEIILSFYSLIVLANLARLLFSRKIQHLFVDDWSIFNDFSMENQGINSTNSAPYNGHSLIVTRILFIFITKTIGIDISTFSIFLTMSLVLTVLLLAQRIATTATPGLKKVTALSIVIVCLNLNQYQNLTMPICWSWVICLIALIWTYLLANQSLNVYRGTLFLALAIIGPLTLSFGFIIPGFIVLKIIYEIYLGKRNLGRVALLVCVTLCTLTSYKIAILNSQREYGGFANPIKIITQPINSIIFLLTSIGSPLTPASRFAVLISSVFGLVIVVLLIRILRSTKSTSAFFLDDAFITLGIIFHMIHLLGRYDGSWSSILIAVQPRYSTGALLLVLGVLLKLIKLRTKHVNLLLIVLLGAMTLSGMKTSEDFSSVRHGESVRIANCISSYSITAPQCEGLLYPGESVLSQEEFKEALIYLKNVN
jgi:hypothetical protein